MSFIINKNKTIIYKIKMCLLCCIPICCCCKGFSAKCMETSALVSSSIGALIQIVGLVILPWKSTSTAGLITYIISLAFFIYSIIISIVFLYWRSQGLINTSKNSTASGLAISAIVITILGVIVITIADIIISRDFYDHKETKVLEGLCRDRYGYYDCTLGTIKNVDDAKMVKDGEYYFALLTTSIADIMYILNLFFFYGSYIRINARVDGGMPDGPGVGQRVYGAQYDMYGSPYERGPYNNARVIIIERNGNNTSSERRDNYNYVRNRGGVVVGGGDNSSIAPPPGSDTKFNKPGY